MAFVGTFSAAISTSIATVITSMAAVDTSSAITPMVIIPSVDTINHSNPRATDPY